MMYGLVFTMWFLGADGHMTKGDIYKTEAECTKIAEAFNTAKKEWLFDAVCIKSGISP